MGETNFRSEEEQISSLLDESRYPLCSNEDPVIFHNYDYERKLLMEYDLDIGEFCGSSSEAQDSFIQWSPPDDLPQSPKNDVTLAATSGPLIKVESPERLSAKRRSPYSSNTDGYSTKRGRPSKQTSNSKMANYARNYREMKKMQLSSAEVRRNELEEEVRLLREENRRMHDALEDAQTEISLLRKVIDNDSSIAQAVARLNDIGASPQLFTAVTGVCLHVGDRGTTVEVCKFCTENAKERLDNRFKLEEPFDSTMELFNGDFSSIEHLIS